ncbi:MAG: hypothetical protein KDA51_07710, partial [Planctomycetales bacterium]|nr:hypothetical protein [Planctomycetales bacterium]
MPISLIPETAPFDSDQRAWLNGFFAGMLGVQEANNHGQVSHVADAASSVVSIMPLATGSQKEVEEEEDFPWHDPALSMDERLQLAGDKPVARKLMAAMAQLDCGACGYLCKTYSEAIA